MPKMTDREKEKAKRLLVFDLAKGFVDKLETFLEMDQSIWSVSKKFTLSDNKLNLKFQLNDAKMDEIIEKLDKEQTRIDKFGKQEQELEGIPAD